MGMPEDYAEIVLTCEGDFYDTSFHVHLNEFRCRFEQLVALDNDEVVVKKVEPWNSVRLTLNIPRHAVTKLQELARSDNSRLRSLGILSVQIEGDQAISLTVAGKNQEPTQIVFKVPSDPSSARTSSVPNSSSADDRNYAALQQFAQLLSQNGNVSVDSLLKLAAGNGGIAAASTSAASNKKHSATSHSPSALQSGSTSVHPSSHAAKGVLRMDAAKLSSNSPTLVNLLQNGAAWASEVTMQQSAAILTKPKRIQRRKKKNEQLTNTAAPLASDGDNSSSAIATSSNITDLVTNSMSESTVQQHLSIEVNRMSSAALAGSYLGSSGSVTSSVPVANPGANSLPTGIGTVAASMPMLPPGLMMMPLGGVNPLFGAMNSHNMLNAISLMPAAQFLNLAALTTPQVSLPNGQLPVNNSAPAVSSSIQSDATTAAQASDVPLITASSLSLLNQIMNQHIPALLVSQVPNSQTGTTNTSIIPVSVALGTPNFPLPVPTPMPSQTSVPATSTSPLLLNPTAAAVAALFGMTSLLGNSPLSLSSNTSLAPSVSTPAAAADLTVSDASASVNSSTGSLLTSESEQSVTDTISSGSMLSNNVMSTISLDDVLASVVALDGEVFPRAEDEHTTEDSSAVSQVKDAVEENGAGQLSEPAIAAETELSPGELSHNLDAPVKGVISERNCLLHPVCRQVSVVTNGCTSVMSSDSHQLSPRLLSISETAGCKCSLSSAGVQTSLSPKCDESMYLHVSTSSAAVTTNAMTVSQANVTWATSPLMTVTKSDLVSAYPAVTMANVVQIATTSPPTIESQKLSFAGDSVESIVDTNVNIAEDNKSCTQSITSSAEAENSLASLVDSTPVFSSDEKSARNSSSSEEVLDSNVDLMKTESVPHVMQVTTACVTFSESVLPNTRSRRSLPHHVNQVTKQSTAGSVHLLGTLDELRSVVDSPTVVLPRIKFNGTAFVAADELTVDASAKLTRPALVRTRMLTSSIGDYTTLSQSATSLVTSIANGAGITHASGRDVIVDDEAVEVSLSSDNCSTAALLSASGPQSADASVSSRDHVYPAHSSGDVTSSSVGNHDSVSNMRTHRSGKTNCVADHASDLLQKKENDNGPVSVTNCVNQSELQHNNDSKHRELRSRSKRPPQKEDSEPAHGGCNGTPAKRSRPSPSSVVDQEEGQRGRGKRVRRKTDNSSVSDTADDLNNRESDDASSTASLSSTNHQLAGTETAEKTRSSASPTLRRSSRSVKAKRLIT